MLEGVPLRIVQKPFEIPINSTRGADASGLDTESEQSSSHEDEDEEGAMLEENEPSMETSTIIQQHARLVIAFTLHQLLVELISLPLTLILL